ncbi:SCO3242 family prenyltransferase [Streptomyces sp. NPDC051907]|uniref:SCO3242 family prenyltransferase n=1 Tax=Streptomyces sp. NPDC051907 TaxID=3155284 RepID=UPI00341C23BC
MTRVNRTTRTTLRAWAELLRVSALLTVPGDALAGAATTGRTANRGTAYALGASLCLYEAGMALNDWADRDEDAAERPHRPIPSGRIAPPAALAASAALTAAGLTLAARAGRAPLAVATTLAATVWSYDLRLKHTKAAAATMAAARALDLLLGATATTATATASAGAGAGAAARVAATAGAGAGAGAGVAARGALGAPRRGGSLRTALPSAALLGAHTYAVTSVSRHETQGGSTLTPLAALASTALLGAMASRAGGRLGSQAGGDLGSRAGGDLGSRAGGDLGGTGSRRGRGLGGPGGPPPSPRPAPTPARLLAPLLAAAYVRTAGTPFLHAALNPSPPLTQRAVGGGIRAMIPLQAALAARTGAGVTGLAVVGLVPIARRLARKVSPT